MDNESIVEASIRKYIERREKDESFYELEMKFAANRAFEQLARKDDEQRSGNQTRRGDYANYEPAGITTNRY